MEHLRKPLSDWDARSLAWTTQFNDLRDPTSLGSRPDEQHRRVQLELKVLVLLLPRMVIRDADLTNHLVLLRMFDKDAQQIRAAVESGTIVLGLRRGVPSLAALNEKTGIARAHPDRYAIARNHLPIIDAWLHQRQLVLLETPVDTEVDCFAANIEKVLASQLLTQRGHDVLAAAVAASRSAQEPNTLLRFANVYEYLHQNCPQQEMGEVLQWCRAAHVLVAPSTHGLAPSTADRDLPPEMVSMLYQSSDGFQADERWLSLYPTRILTPAALARMTFADIERLRVVGHGLGYFAAAVAVQRAASQAEFERVYQEYLSCLADYLAAISTDLRVELVPWQKELLERRVRRDGVEQRIRQWGIPLLLLAPGALELWSWGAISVAGLLTAGAALLRDYRDSRQPRTLTRLLSGTTVTPAR